MTHVFSRASRDLPTAVSADGVWITDADGKKYLDGAGGAIVVNVGHGVASVIDAIKEQVERTQYVHPTAFTTDAVEAYAEEVAAILPMEDARIYPVSGGSEAVETALKMARAYHLAKGRVGRSVVIARRNSYHGNTLGALDASGKAPLRKPYTPWLGRFLHVSAAYEFRCENPQHPHGCAAWHAAELDKMIESYGEDTVAAFIAEPVSGATLGAAVPADDYWPAIVEVCRRHDVVLDRGRGDDRVRSHGFVVRRRPLGRAAGHPHRGQRARRAATCPSGSPPPRAVVYEAIAEGPGFVHGFTWSHNALGAAAGLAVLRELKAGLVDRSRELGERLLSGLREELQDAPTVGDVRGLGLMIGIELVRDRESHEPFPRSATVAERILAAARDAGLLLYSSTGHVDGANGDIVMLGPPFSLSDEEAATLLERTTAAVRAVS